jgi:hypothetical protein
MISLIVSYLLLAYLLIPRALFKGLSGSRLKFQRTRTDEIVFAFTVSSFPFALSIEAAKLYGWPTSKTLGAYEEIFAAAYSESYFDKTLDSFWNASGTLFWTQAHFLSGYYLAVGVEALLFLGLLKMYGRWHGKNRGYDWIIKRLLHGLNEWYVLLSLFNFGENSNRKVNADLLTEEDHLYQGSVAEHFIDGDGGLSGIVLRDPYRFDRAGYLRDKKVRFSTKPDTYWKPIPSRDLYIPAIKILSLNLRYPKIMHVEIPSSSNDDSPTHRVTQPPRS